MFGVLALAVLAPGTASAHERRAVGDYTFVVGFLKEPAFEGETNGIDLRVTRGDQPIEGLEQSLKAEVIVGAQTMPVSLRPRFRQPGAYDGHFVPTRAGSYTFRFTGTIDGLAVDERFESGPGRFNDVQALTPLQFPDKVPSTAELLRAVQAAEGRAATATTLAVAGLVVGVLGVGLAGWALASRRRAPALAAAAGGRTAPAASQERL
jgi:hypothetical protein